MSLEEETAKVQHFYHFLVINTNRWIGTNIYPSPTYQEASRGLVGLPDPVMDAFAYEIYRTTNTLAFYEGLKLQPKIREPLARVIATDPIIHERQAKMLTYKPTLDLREFIETLMFDSIKAEFEAGPETYSNRPININRLRFRNYMAEGMAENIRNVRMVAVIQVLNAYFLENKRPVVTHLPIL